MNLKAILIGSALGVVAVMLCFLCADCCAGTTVRYDCRVSGRQFIEPWTEVDTSTDSDGHVHVTTTRHEAEFHLFCDPLDDGKTINVNTTAVKYHTITNGQEVTVSVRSGRWTGVRWLPTLENP